jgi:hypothetical protein
LSPKQSRINLVVSSTLIIATLVTVIATPIVRGEHDETGLMLSWFTTPAAAFLFSTTRINPGLVVTSGFAAAIIALAVALITYALWQAYAEMWMFNYLYTVLAIVVGSVLFEVFAAVMIALVASALRPRTSERLQ